MRDIGKYRGKRLDNGEWVYGYYCFTTFYAGKQIRKAVIISESDLCNHCLWKPNSEESPVEVYEVDPKTVGVSTGENDKAGNEAYRSDILQTSAGRAVIMFGEYRGKNDGPEEPHTGFYLKFENDENNRLFSRGISYWLPLSEIKGNIHDNPELLEVEDK